MPKKTYIQLNSITLAAASSSVTFFNIPQNYRDLVLVGEVTGSSAVAFLFLRFNDISTDYSGVQFYGPGPGSNSVAFQPFYAIYGLKRSITIGQIMDYSVSDKHKTSLVRGNNAEHSEVAAGAYRWANSSPITSVSLVAESGTISIGSIFTLYGIEA
jgi:hypothetical protein